MVAHAVETGHLREEVNGLVDLSRFCLYVDRRQCLPFAEQALAKSRAIDDPAFRALVQGNLANLDLMLRGWRKEDADFCRQAAMLIAESQDLSMRMRRCSMEMVLEFLSSNYPACCDATRRGRELARMVGDVYLFALYNTVEAFALLYLGEWGEVREIVASALAISERNVNPQASALCRPDDRMAARRSDRNSRAPQAVRKKRSIRLLKRIRSVSLSAGPCWRKPISGWAICPWRASSSMRSSRRIEIAGVPMESLIVPHYFLNCCDYWLEAGDLDQAQKAAARLHEITGAAPDRPFLALVAQRDGTESRWRGKFPSGQIAFVPRPSQLSAHARLPLAAWRVYATAARLL